jgi:C-terminal processing protease CtpA/Prc
MIADYKDNPYKIAGLKEEDEIISVNGKNFKNITDKDGFELDKADTLQWIVLRNSKQIKIVIPVDKNYDRVD